MPGLTSMDEAHAEAVLMALGGPLDWRDAGAGNDNFAYARAGGYSYSVCKPGVKSCFAYARCNARFHTVFELKYVLSFSAAKAACERHHATGSWE